MKKGFILLVSFICLTSAQVLANTDSLWNVWQNSQNHDTVRLEAIKKYLWDQYMYSNPDSALVIAELQLKFAEKIKNNKYISSAYNSMGVANYVMGNQNEAIRFYDLAYEYSKAAGYKNGMSSNLCNKALIFTDQSNYKPAIETYFKAIKIFEETNDSLKLGQIYNNMAVIYNEQKYNDLALEYYTKSLEIKQGLGDPLEVALAITNLAAFYADVGKNQKAEILYQQALDISIKEEYKPGLAVIYANLSALYSDVENKTEEALIYRLKALDIYKDIGDISAVANQELGLGGYYYTTGKLYLAEQYLNSALETFLELGVISRAAVTSNELYKVHLKNNDFKKALEFLEMNKVLEDSVIFSQNKDATLKLKYEFDYEKKTLADSIEFAKKEEVNLLKLSEQEAQIQKDRTQKYALFGGIGLMLIFGAFAYRTFRRKKRDHEVITLQHHELEESHHEIKQSIDYAKHLQDVFLPSHNILQEHFPQHFVLFMPKDVVSGDFYWFDYHEASQTKIMAVADCTGHGVPGALVSIVCSNALNKAVKELEIIEPAAILDKTRELVIETFTKAGKDVRDGMDITICAIHGQTLKVAGANNGLWLVQKTEGEGDNIQEFKADRQSVGWQEKLVPFSQEEMTLSKGDTIYLLTDGFPDQFGGEKGKKLKKTALKSFLLDIQNQDMPAQEKRLAEKFSNWRGNNDQVDDVCVMGIRF